MIFSVKFANTLFNFLKKGPPYGAFNYNLGFSALLGHPPVKSRVVLETSSVIIFKNLVLKILKIISVVI